MLALYIHLVWATWDCLPFITTAIERHVHRSIAQEVVRCGCKVLAINGIEDHVHVLTAFPATTDVATVVKQAKGVSSRCVNDALQPTSMFKWQKQLWRIYRQPLGR